MRTFEEYLCEVGDSKNPYSYKVKHDPMNRAAIVKFKTDSGFRYWADFTPEIFPSMEYSALKFDFGVYHKDPDRSTFDTTNAGLKEMFRVMSTLVKSLKEYIVMMNKKYDIKFDEIIYDSSEVGKPGEKAGEQRSKLYAAFIKKNLKGAVIKNSGPYTAVKLGKRYYK